MKKAILILLVTIVLSACTQVSAPSPLAGRWVTEMGMRVYQIDNAGSMSFGTINYPFVKGLSGTWSFSGITLDILWSGATSLQYTVAYDASSMTWTANSLAARLVKVSETDYPAIVIQSAAVTDAAYTLGLSENFSIGIAASQSLAESLYKSSLVARGYSAAIVQMTLVSGYSDQDTNTWSCDVYLQP